MPLSLGSYLLGVGTVVGALAFGFGGGVLLTHTAMKEDQSSAQTKIAQTRMARAHVEPVAVVAPQAPTTPAPNQAAVAPNAVTAPDQDRPASVAGVQPDTAPAQPPAADPPAPVPAVQAATPKQTQPTQIQATKEPEPMKQAAREPQPPKQVEQSERTQSERIETKSEAKFVEPREPDHRAERSRRYADRRQPDIVSPKTRQRRFIVQEEPAQEQEEPVQEVVAPRPPEQQHFDLLGGLFGRPADNND